MITAFFYEFIWIPPDILIQTSPNESCCFQSCKKSVRVHCCLPWLGLGFIKNKMDALNPIQLSEHQNNVIKYTVLTGTSIITIQISLIDKHSHQPIFDQNISILYLIRVAVTNTRQALQNFQNTYIQKLSTSLFLKVTLHTNITSKGWCIWAAPNLYRYHSQLSVQSWLSQSSSRNHGRCLFQSSLR